MFAAGTLGQLCVIGFQNGGPAPGDLPFRPDAEGDAVEQGGRISGVVQHRPQDLAGQIGGGGLVPGVLVYRLFQQLPDGQGLKLVIGGANDLQPPVVGLDVFQESPEGIVEEKAH